MPKNGDSPSPSSHDTSMVPALRLSRNRRAGHRIIGATCLVLLASTNAFAPTLSGGAEVTQPLNAKPRTADPHSEVLRGPSGVLDSHSCLGCHDGSVASNMLNKVCNISSRFSDRWSNDSLSQRFSHPIGVDYQVARQLRPGARLKDIALLPSVIKLENGATGCLSCHDPASPRPYRLVMDNAESRLCFACHDL
jgi:predicted CXXCH cytochrome family protein